MKTLHASRVPYNNNNDPKCQWHHKGYWPQYIQSTLNDSKTNCVQYYTHIGKLIVLVYPNYMSNRILSRSRIMKLKKKTNQIELMFWKFRTVFVNYLNIFCFYIESKFGFVIRVAGMNDILRTSFKSVSHFILKLKAPNIDGWVVVTIGCGTLKR